ncbi:MAG: nucleotidyltransferase family protein [Prevotellaceae bacterium]|jgi:NDP-sugar pyrophosphorylase family protein|nr:nucleotidyltransferase family protein [Prevotellaceae bacterium]
MKAMIFAAGLGTRLKPLTDSMPKAMVPIAGKPLLEHCILKLKTAGFNEIIINVHHFADQIIEFLRQKNNFDIRIEISDERDALLETGGGIKRAAPFFDDEQPFLVHNVDILSDIDLQALYALHVEQNALATLAVSPRKTSRYLLFDDENRLQGWINDSTGETKSPFSNFVPSAYQRFAFSGVHIISPRIFDFMCDFPAKFSIIDFYLSVCGKEKIIASPLPQLRLIDVGKLDSLQQAEAFFL